MQPASNLSNQPWLVLAGISKLQFRIGPGRVNLTGDSMYDDAQAIIADYLLRYRGIPLGILKSSGNPKTPRTACSRGRRYANRLMIRHSIATNGHDWIITDNLTGEYETLRSPPTPLDIVNRLGVTIDWDRWETAFTAGFHIDQVTRKRVRPYQEIAIAKTLWQFAQGTQARSAADGHRHGQDVHGLPADLEAE